MLDKEHIIWRQKKWEKRWAQAAELEAEEEAARVAKMEAEDRKQ